MHLGRPILLVYGHLDEADDLADDLELFTAPETDTVQATVTRVTRLGFEVRVDLKFNGDDVWAQVEDEFDPEEIGALLFGIATINVYNRLNVAVQTEPGHYVPGMFA